MSVRIRSSPGGLLAGLGTYDPSERCSATKWLMELAALAARYGLDVDLESVPRLTQEYGLDFGKPPE
jgi:hypothetical protein